MFDQTKVKMNNKEVKILAYYAHPGDREKRDSNILAAYNFINYVRDSIIKVGRTVKIISASRTRGKNKFYGKRLDVESEDFSVLYLPTFPKNNKINKLLDIIALHVSVFKELLKCGRHDTVIVYHSTACMNTIQLAHWIKRFNWILYVGEIFGDVSHNIGLKNKELHHSLHADSYIFATEFLDKLINKYNKPYVVLYGAYHNEPLREDVLKEKDTTKTHCIYAGTFDQRKGESQQSIRAAAFLKDNYQMHICGFGTEKDTSETVQMINEINRKYPNRIVYEGRVYGENFIKLLQRCDIGMFTPLSQEEFNNSDFPSKIFSYMTNGLRVVSAKVEPVEKSQIGECMYYYDGDNPYKIAEAIMNIDLTQSHDSRAIVTKVEKEYIESLDNLLK